MTPLMVKGVLFGLLLLSAAVWDMRNREIPNLIPALLLLCGLIGFRPAASAAGLLLVGGCGGSDHRYPYRKLFRRQFRQRPGSGNYV